MGEGLLIIGLAALIFSYMLRVPSVGYHLNDLIADILLYLSPVLIVVGIVWIIVKFVKKKKQD